ncbi:MAG TPA: hypothetical protein VGF88_16665 [Acidobacteriaceae bacterium]|jgi:hypothetical protein
MFSNLWEIAKIAATSTIVLGVVAAAIRMYIDYQLKGRLDEQRELLKGFLATDSIPVRARPRPSTSCLRRAKRVWFFGDFGAADSADVRLGRGI